MAWPGQDQGLNLDQVKRSRTGMAGSTVGPVPHVCAGLQQPPQPQSVVTTCPLIPIHELHAIKCVKVLSYKRSRATDVLVPDLRDARLYKFVLLDSVGWKPPVRRVVQNPRPCPAT